MAYQYHDQVYTLKKSKLKKTPVLFIMALYTIDMHANNLDIRWQLNRQRSYGTHIQWNTAAAAKSLQSCLTLCDPRDGSPPGSPVPGFSRQEVEWVAISFFNAWKWKVKVKSLSRVWPSATPWTAAFQAPPSMGFSRQEYWSGVPLPSLSISKFHTQA